ncbi:MAG: HIT domain-containing protein [Rhodothermales bacterium]|nr:HIT domain-containing protein [Rhodothermales bacterium]
MDRVYSPWRAEHVSRVSNDDSYDADVSIFARIAESTDDADNLVVWRGETVFVLMNLYPYTNGHVMIVPFRQVGEFEELNHNEVFEISITAQFCIRWLKTVMNPDGFNMGLNLGTSAGAGITKHIHMHIVPRWTGDTNFTSTVGDFRVIPQSIEDTYKRLADAARKNPVELPNSQSLK